MGDGAEYDGRYGAELGEEFLFKWHEPRFTTLVNNQNTDILAMETVPCITEVRALLHLLRTRPEAKAWISVSCSSPSTLCSGENIADFV